MRFLVDENLPAVVCELLAHAGHDVLDVATTGHRGSTDETLWQLAIDEGRNLVTRDRDFPLRGAHGRPPGIVLVRPTPQMRAAEIAALVETAFASTGMTSLTGHVTVIEPGRVRQRPYAKLPP